nr:UDP-glucosyltransferase 391B1 [Meteorus pulchricornis]
MYSQMKFLFLVFLGLGNSAMAARILAVFPYPSYSHQVVHHALTTGLADRGHELIVFTTDPMNKNISNYREVSLKFLYKGFTKQFNFVKLEGLWNLLYGVQQLAVTLSDTVLSHPEMQRLLSSTQSSDKIDLIIMSVMYWDALYYLSDKFNAPLIGISSLSDLSYLTFKLGMPHASSYIPNNWMGYSDQMSFLERLINIYGNLRILHEYYATNLPMQEKILKKHFGDNVPPTDQLSQRISMLFMNSHPYLSHARPTVPAILQIGGIRSEKMNTSLPKGLKKILDDATQGFIYFSLGTNVKSIQLSNHTLKTFNEVFSELPYQVVWKFESEDLEGKPDNVYISKWMPQHGILAHPNIKLFMYQGGLQSSEEAIDNGVPLLGIPVFGDQWYNVNILRVRGVAKTLDIFDADKAEIKETIQEMISNSSYRDNTIKLKELLHDRPQHPLKEAIWWVEHVIRHKGAPHLRTRSRDLSWYTIEMVDVFGFFVLLIVVLFLVGWTLWRLAIAMIKVHGRSCFDKINGPSTMNKKSKTS